MKKIHAILFVLLFSFEAQSQQVLENSFNFNFFFSEALYNRLQGDYSRAMDLYISSLKFNQNSATVYYEISRIYLTKNDLKNANLFIDRAIALDSANVHYMKYAVNLKLNLYQYDQAILLLSRIIEEDPDDANSAILLERLYCSCKDKQNALRVLDGIRPEDQGEIDYLKLERAEIYAKCGNMKEAVKYLAKLYKDNPLSALYTYSYATFLLAQGDTTNGYKMLQKATTLNDGSKYLFDLAELRLKMKNVSDFYDISKSAFANQEIDFYQKYSRLLKYTDGSVLNGRNTHNQKFVQESINKCFEMYPEQEELYNFYAHYLILEKRDTVNSIDYFKKFFGMTSGDPDDWLMFLRILEFGTEDYKNYSEIAYDYYPDDPFIGINYVWDLTYSKEFTKAYEPCKTLYDRALDNFMIDSDTKGFYSTVLESMAEIYHELDSLDQCFECYDRLLEKDEYNTMALNNFSYYLSLVDRDLDKAEKMIRTAVNLEPNNPVFLDTYAWILFRKKLYTDAKFIMDMAMEKLKGVELEEDRSVYYEHYGDILYHCGYPDDALKNWKKAQEYDEENEILNKKVSENEYFE
ncbi:MAG: tetratricopeptide repeat protein [Oscillospiraceae bacterium]|nr:tetratricopeptide repeat protein [Oscillospiraceae bacterium]